MAKKTIDRTPETLDLALYAGDGVSIRLSLTNSTGDPVEITGEMKAQIRPTTQTVEVSTEFTTTPEEGSVVISLSGTQTASLIENDDQFKGVWDLQWSPTGGEPVTLVKGAVTCDADVTR